MIVTEKRTRKPKILDSPYSHEEEHVHKVPKKRAIRKTSVDEKPFDPFKAFHSKVQHYISKANIQMHIIETFTARQEKDLESPRELFQAEVKLLECEIAIRHILENLWDPRSEVNQPYSTLTFESENEVDEDEILCCRKSCPDPTSSTDTDDVYLCDYVGCNRAYHISCIIGSTETPGEEDDWICPRCMATVEILEKINESFEGIMKTDFDVWTDVFANASTELKTLRENEQEILAKVSIRPQGSSDSPNRSSDSSEDEFIGPAQRIKRIKRKARDLAYASNEWKDGIKNELASTSQNMSYSRNPNIPEVVSLTLSAKSSGNKPKKLNSTDKLPRSSVALKSNSPNKKEVNFSPQPAVVVSLSKTDALLTEDVESEDSDFSCGSESSDEEDDSDDSVDDYVEEEEDPLPSETPSKNCRVSLRRRAKIDYVALSMDLFGGLQDEFEDDEDVIESDLKSGEDDKVSDTSDDSFSEDDN